MADPQAGGPHAGAAARRQRPHTWHHGDDLLFGIAKHGLEPFVEPGYESDMPAFDGALGDDEIWAVLAFIKTSWPERERAFQEHITRAEREAKR